MGTFDDRLGFDFTYFNDLSKDAILSRGVAPSTGYGSSSQFFNAGEIQKSGVELGIKAQIMQRRAYGWESAFNIATNSGTIKRLNGTDSTSAVGSYLQHHVGYAPYSWFTYRVVSATYDNDPAVRAVVKSTIKCDDGKGGSIACYAANGSIQAPKVYLGRGIPSYEGSWTNTIRFLTNFRVYVMTDYAGGYKRLDNNLRIRCQIFYTCMDNVNPAAADPVILAQMTSSGTFRGFLINDASYVKLREVSLSYDMPDRFASKIGAHGVTFTASARNLHTWTNYSGLDPEMTFVSGSNFGVDQAEFPPLTSLVFTFRANY
jgi:hypothetical protein